MPPAEAPPRPARPAAGARRTVVIRGQVAPRAGGTESRLRQPRPARRGRPRRPSERIAGTRPDRAALWAVMMGVFLIVVAVVTAHGA
ncbi:MAG TPA: hypothetical protein VN635_08320 [Conexibacter sp.]|nr:hypothetical protein [Conexibacter sp.]